jgi:hypothetical protein
MVCGVCRAPHHLDCWADNGGCAVVACAGGPTSEHLTPATAQMDPLPANPAPASLQQIAVHAQLTREVVCPTHQPRHRDKTMRVSGRPRRERRDTRDPAGHQRWPRGFAQGAVSSATRDRERVDILLPEKDRIATPESSRGHRADRDRSNPRVANLARAQELQSPEGSATALPLKPS